MFPDLIKIGNFTIHTYGVLVALGLLSAYFISLYLAKKENLDRSHVENLFIYTVIGGIVGARAAYVLEHRDQFRSLIDIIAIWNGGIDWFGAFIGGSITLITLLKIYKIPILKVGDVASVSVALGHTLGRIGCTCAGCCYGKPVPEDSPFRDIAIVFPNNPNTVAPHGVPLYPTQPAEAIGNFLIFIILFIMYRNKKFDGQIFSMYLVMYGIERFLLEFWRGVTPPLPVINLTWNQIISIGSVVVGLLILLYRLKIYKVKEE